MSRLYSMMVRAFVVAVTVSTCAGTAIGIPIGASGDFNLPSIQTEHFGTQGGGFEITADIELDPGAGPWIKKLTNQGSSASSGSQFQIIETFTNVGNIPWTDWHEEIQTLTSIGGGPPVHGFLFNSNSLNLMADYGTGFVGLAEGADYQLVTMPYDGPPIGGNNNNWHAIWIFFELHATIQPGDSLKIEKQIFEVFGDSDIWQSGESVEIAQYPTPEPTTLALGAPLIATMMLRRHRTLS